MSMFGYARRSYIRVMSSLNYVRADKIMLNPCLAKDKAIALPIPSDEPVTSAQLFLPYLLAKLRLLLSMHL